MEFLPYKPMETLIAELEEFSDKHNKILLEKDGL